jgi:hypothetical protein
MLIGAPSDVVCFTSLAMFLGATGALYADDVFVLELDEERDDDERASMVVVCCVWYCITHTIPGDGDATDFAGLFQYSTHDVYIWYNTLTVYLTEYEHRCKHKLLYPPIPSSSFPPCFTPTLAGGLNCPKPFASYSKSVLMTNFPPSAPTALPSCNSEP